MEHWINRLELTCRDKWRDSIRFKTREELSKISPRINLRQDRHGRRLICVGRCTGIKFEIAIYEACFCSHIAPAGFRAARPILGRWSTLPRCGLSRNTLSKGDRKSVV